MPPRLATTPPRPCIICQGPASPPSRTGWISANGAEALFSVCGSCSDCTNLELEAKVVAKGEAQTLELAPAE
jgi:hypothetical protein